jgi:hypothetical protein
VTLAAPPLRRAASSAGVGTAVLLAVAPASASAASERFRCDAVTAEGHKAASCLNGPPSAAARTSEPGGRARQTGAVPGGDVFPGGTEVAFAGVELAGHGEVSGPPIGLCPPCWLCCGFLWREPLQAQDAVEEPLLYRRQLLPTRPLRPGPGAEVLAHATIEASAATSWSR